MRGVAESACGVLLNSLVSLVEADPAVLADVRGGTTIMQSERLTDQVTIDVAGKAFRHSREGLRIANNAKEETEWVDIPQIRLGGTLWLVRAITAMMSAFFMYLSLGRRCIMLWYEGRAV